MVCVAGDTETEDVLAVTGVQLYVPPAIDELAVSMAVPPGQMVVSAPIERVGAGVIVTIPESTAVPQPAILYVRV